MQFVFVLLWGPLGQEKSLRLHNVSGTITPLPKEHISFIMYKSTGMAVVLN